MKNIIAAFFSSRSSCSFSLFITSGKITVEKVLAHGTFNRVKLKQSRKEGNFLVKNYET